MLKSSQNKVIVLCGIIVFLASIYSMGYHHVDEHFQILEFAGAKLGMLDPNLLPWEYEYKMRPTLQPFMVVVLHKILAPMDLDTPFIVTFILRFITGILLVTALYMMYKVFRDKIKGEQFKKWFLTLSFLTWFLLYNGIRFSSENWSGLAFVFGFVIYFLTKEKSLKHHLIIGLLLGLSFVFRYQGGFMIAGFMAWLLIINKEKIKNLMVMAGGVLASISAGILVDKWYYGEWTFSALNYLNLNIIEDKVSSFGLQPWYYYFTEFFGKGFAPISILFIIAVLIYIVVKRKSVVTWIVVPFLLIHFAIGHKELRFLFPIVFFLPVMLVEVMEYLEEKLWPNLSTNKITKVLMTIILSINLILAVVVGFRPANQHVPLYKIIYNDYENPVVLHFIEHDPYNQVTGIRYYKRRNLTTKQISTVDEISFSRDTTNLVVVLNTDKIASDFENEKLIFSSFPEWVKSFNFFGWVDRTIMWKAYEVTQ